MKLNRFIRDYELIVTLTNGEVVKITPELRIQFEITKSIRGAVNSAKILIYNLSENKRAKLIKDKERDNVYIQAILKAGYVNSKNLIFKGNIIEAFSIRQGPDFITQLTSLDGGYDLINAFTSKTIKDGDYIKHIAKDFKYIDLGKVTELPKLTRPKVLVGNSFYLIEKYLDFNKTFYIDNEKLNIISDNEAIKNYIPIVSAETGLLETPVKKLQELHFKTLLNPALQIGCLVKLQSESAKHLNGVYRIDTIKYKGDYNGLDWTQEVVCRANTNWRLL